MAGAIKKMAEYLGLVDDDGRYNDGYDDEETAPADTRRRSHAPQEDPDDDASTVATLPNRRPAPGTPVRAVKERAELSRITTLHPRTYNDARVVGEHFRDGTPVIMNLTSMDDQDAKRLVDFAAGLIFGLRGTLEKITTKVFLLSPADIEVTAEDKARIIQTEFFNQS
jgi:cell division inhibitor SepF